MCCPIGISNNGLANGRHTLTSGPGVDPYSLGQIPVVAPGGGNFSVRLGNDNVNSQAEMLQYTVSVTPQTALFIYRYAVVLEDPAHSATDQPRFEIRLYDQSGQNIQCGIYNVVASANIPGFQNNGNIRFKPWTTVGIDLSPFMGQNVTIEFRTGDCGLGAHFGYAYIDCSCGPLQIRNAFCPNSPNVTLEAPEGFSSYLWSNGATTSAISVPISNVGVVYSCTITSVTGCTVTLTTQIASSSITAAFTTSINCQNNAIFTDQTNTFNGTPISWSWDFGDGQTSSLQNPSHNFQSPGLYNVTLISENDIGCKDTITNQVLIWPSPVAVATATNVCEDTPVQLNNASNISIGNIVSHDWLFSDSTTSSQISPSHIFSGTGNFTAQLIVTSDLGCKDTALVNIQVHPYPVVEAGPPVSVCGGSNVSIGSALNNPSMSYQWFPAQYVLNTASPLTVLQIPSPVSGNQDLTYFLTVTNNSTGCSNTDSVKVEAKALPVASYQTPQPQCLQGNSFDLIAAPTFPGTVYTWVLSMNTQPGIVTNNSVSGISYAQTGEFPVTLIVNNNGCTDTTTHLLKVVEEPNVNLSIQKEGCPSLTVDFESQVTPAGSYYYQWSFSDNTTSSEEKPTHTFTIPGTYSVGLQVTNTEGCSDNVLLKDVIKVLPGPVARFSTESEYANVIKPEFTFINLSQGAIGYNWNFGDNTFSTDFHATHTYKDTGVYNVWLIVENSFGCVDTTVSPVTVEPFFTFYVPNAFTPNGDGVNDFFRGLGTYMTGYEMWIYDRWGLIVYHTDDYSKPWDGKGKYDNVAQNDVYEYIIVVKDSKRKEHKYIGHVSLVR